MKTIAIQVNAATQSVFELFDKQKNGVHPGVSFADCLHAQRELTAQKVRKEVEESCRNPVGIYERMTMRSASESPGSSKNVRGVGWNDQMLAVLAGTKYGVEVDTAKTIQWDSTGDKTLTKEDIRSLREKYDVERLSPQDYYDLLSDLTHKNVISAEDIHNMHFSTMLSPGFLRSDSFLGEGFDLNNHAFTSGSILDAVQEELTVLFGLNQAMTADDFWLRNSHISTETYTNYISDLKEKTASMQKLQEIFTSLKR